MPENYSHTNLRNVSLSGRKSNAPDLFGTRSGIGLLCLILAFIPVIVMYIVGTIARATANSLSLIIFVVGVLAGGIYGRSVGGGAGKITNGFEGLHRVGRVRTRHAAFRHYAAAPRYLPTIT